MKKTKNKSSAQRIGPQAALLLRSRFASKAKQSAKTYSKSNRRNNKVPHRSGGVFFIPVPSYFPLKSCDIDPC